MALPETHVATCSSILDADGNQLGPGDLYALKDDVGQVVLYRVAVSSGVPAIIRAEDLKRAMLV